MFKINLFLLDILFEKLIVVIRALNRPRSNLLILGTPGTCKLDIVILAYNLIGYDN